jgi:RHS repeat-associated protein
MNRDNFDGSIFDADSDLQMLGFRMYDNETGRFTTPDLLWSAFPAQTPYHYAYNSPMTLRDPSGLAPEKEKEGEELMGNLTEEDLENLENAYRLLSHHNDARSADRDFMKGPFKTCKQAWSERPRDDKNDGGGDRTGGSNSSAENGQGGAWKITNEWTDEMIEKYREFAPKQAKMYKESGKEFTCEDLALQILIDFASQNELPLSITNGEGTFDASSTEFNSPQNFANKVLTTTGANDLISFGNTTQVPLGKLQSGDILVERKDGRSGNHVQVVGTTTSSSIYIYQGNSGVLNGIRGSSFILGAGNPASVFYTGKSIETGHIYISTGTFINFLTKQFYPGYLNNFNVKGVQWNFQKWKK